MGLWERFLQLFTNWNNTNIYAKKGIMTTSYLEEFCTSGKFRKQEPLWALQTGLTT